MNKATTYTLVVIPSLTLVVLISWFYSQKSPQVTEIENVPAHNKKQLTEHSNAIVTEANTPQTKLQQAEKLWEATLRQSITDEKDPAKRAEQLLAIAADSQVPDDERAIALEHALHLVDDNRFADAISGFLNSVDETTEHLEIIFDITGVQSPATQLKTLLLVSSYETDAGLAARERLAMMVGTNYESTNDWNRLRVAGEELLQQSQTPDVQEANLSEKATFLRYRGMKGLDD